MISLMFNNNDVQAFYYTFYSQLSEHLILIFNKNIHLAKSIVNYSINDTENNWR